MRFRKALLADAFSIMQLYQYSQFERLADPMFLDYKRLEQAMLNPNSNWIVGEINGTVRTLISMNLDLEQRICKIARMMVDPRIPESKSILRETLNYVLHILENNEQPIDIVYTTTLSLTLEEQEMTHEEGFKILGIFPNLSGEDQTKLNGLTAYFYSDVLEKKRQSTFFLHPTIEPFFQISRKQCGLNDLPISQDKVLTGTVPRFCEYTQKENSNDLKFEVIRAPQYVKEKFKKIKQRCIQYVDFYPFHYPNCLITDAHEEVQIFVRIFESMRFAAIISEHLERQVNPVEMYKKVQDVLRSQNVYYIEILNDAADVYGIDCILSSGFTPCAYFPAFRRQGETRRDVVVFGKSFEYLCTPKFNKYKTYLEFYKEYFKIEGKNYFPLGIK